MADEAIRTAVVTDLPFIFRCDLAYMREFSPDHTIGWALATDRQLETWIHNLHRFFVIEVGEETAGLVLWVPVDDEPGKAVIVTIHTIEKFRRRGLAKRLLEKAVEDAKANGFPTMTLGVDRKNPARKLYEDVGFVYTHEDDSYLYFELKSG